MNSPREPIFLTRSIIDDLHAESIRQHGGTSGLRNEHGLESAIHQPKNVYYYSNGDLYEIAAAYAYHIAESQNYLDGNKRVAILAAMEFLEINGIDTDRLPDQETHDAMIKISSREWDRAALAVFFRKILSP